MILLVLLGVMVPLSSQQCLTAKDDLRKVKNDALESLLHSELEFSVDLARTVTSMQPDQNVFFSPTSVYRALFLAYFLTANQTEKSLRILMYLDPKLDKLDYMGAYYLDNYYQKLRSIKQNGCQMNLANRLYTAKNLKIQHCFKVLFNEELQQANFIENLSGVRRKINQWVATQTNNVIKDFLSEDSLTKNTKLVLLNAAYFKGSWKNEFDKADTHQGQFQLSNGTEVKTPMMTQENKYKFNVDEKLDAEVLELPYTGDEISMFVLLPLKRSASALQDMLHKIDGDTLKSMISTIQTDTNVYDLSVTIPKFTIEETLELTPILEAMGVGDLFQSTADLSTLTGSKGLSFSDAIHKAKVKVNEKGTEAAAVTEFISARMGTPSFNADHPFAYIIYDKVTHKILFFGIFNSPPKKDESSN